MTKLINTARPDAHGYWTFGTCWLQSAGSNLKIVSIYELTDTFAGELGLTEQQKQQIVPILKEEVPKLQALKNDTSLSALEKVRQLREIGSTVDAKITPLLNPEQQHKYQAMRERLRRRLIEKAGSELIEKLERETKLFN